MAMGSAPSATQVYLARVVDALVYGAVVALLASLVSAAIGLLVLGSLNGMKFVLFVAGFGQIALGVISLWPSDVSDIEDTGGPPPNEVSRVQRVVDRLAPTELLGLPVEQRFEHGVRQLVAGVLMLVVSFSMEAAFGVGA